ncbi:MAG: HAMP domain-containing sensor histidine kinase [Lachnospiraceae bacterium]|nr:HAMP domain-containing sensor histidine kinase [Lachnospiraceae bacterium]
MQGYEEKKFNTRFFMWSGAALVFVAVVLFFLLQEFDWKYWVILGMVAMMELAIYLYARSAVHRLYREVSQVSDIMVRIVEGREIPSEQYMQGEIGNLYTNLYKLFSTLNESRMKEMEEKIFLRDIISDISHQLKTPLASLMVFVDLLYDKRVTDEEKRIKLLEEAKNQLTRMEWMVLSMLKLARIEAGAIVFERKQTPLYPILMRAKEGVAYLADERKQTIEVCCEEDQQLVCDGEWLTEAIINLLKNASDYSGEETTITVRVEETNFYTRIIVRDEGIGIPEDALPHIFKRFYRVNSEVNPNSVGIGLSLTKSIIEGMQGKITVRSEQGNFTEFVVTWGRFFCHEERPSVL